MKRLDLKKLDLKSLSLKRPDTPDLVLTAGSVSLILVCLFLLGAPALRNLQDRARASAVQGNAATVQLAAETYAFRNQGCYPEDPLDLVEYLPGEVAPQNPYTGQALLFKNQPGDLTYRSPSRGHDYIIEAWGSGERGCSERILVLKGQRDNR
ncbi:MAG: hypothetical protein KOO60_05245 [Gemmatimonadales bacterium]|nr:hypothetical protein [Gemmatimonadales bacterium]